MVLWTIMPDEAIFAQDYSPVFEDVEFAGTRMLVEKTADDEYRVVRLLSTDPQDYLRYDIQPGTVFRNDYFR